MKFSPDKNPGVKGIQERFARLGVISHILRNQESRERSVLIHFYAISGELMRNGVSFKIRLFLQKRRA